MQHPTTDPQAERRASGSSKTWAKAALIAATLGLWTSPAIAQTDGIYVNLGVSSLSVDPDVQGFGEQDGVYGVFRGGYDIGRHFGVEAEALLGSLGEERVFVADSSVGNEPVEPFEFFDSYEFGNVYSLAVRGRLPLGRSGEVFLRLGASWDDAESSASETRLRDGFVRSSGTFDRSETFLLGGIGGQYMFGATGANGMRLDLTRRGGPSGEDIDTEYIDTVALSYVRRF